MVVGVAARHERALREVESVAVLREDGSLPLRDIVDRSRDALEASMFAAHRLVPFGAGLQAEFCAVSGPEAPVRACFAAFRENSGRPAYHPHRPEKRQRNAVVTLADLDRSNPEVKVVVDELFPKIGLGAQDQIRVLICDGPMLLAWFGGFRAKRFARRDRHFVGALAAAVRPKLRLAQRLRDAAVATAGLEAALETIGAPSFVTDAHGCVRFANEAGTKLYDRGGARVVFDLRERIATLHPSARPLAVQGSRMHYLVTFDDVSRQMDARLEAARRAWSLTPRQVEVLARAVVGDANKSIAVKLGCAEVTVELHLTAIFRKARATNRTELVSRFFTL